MKTKHVIAFAALTAILTGCDKSPNITTTQNTVSQPRVEAEAFHGEVYRSLDGQTALTLISRDECELRTGQGTLLCKYTKQSDALRVVVTALGTNQVVYYRFTAQGIQDNDGAVLLSPDALSALLREREQEAQRAEETRRVQAARNAALIQEARKEGPILGAYKNRRGAIQFTDSHLRIYDVKDKKTYTFWFNDINYSLLNGGIGGMHRGVFLLYYNPHDRYKPTDDYIEMANEDDDAFELFRKQLCAQIALWIKKYAEVANLQEEIPLEPGSPSAPMSAADAERLMLGVAVVSKDLKGPKDPIVMRHLAEQTAAIRQPARGGTTQFQLKVYPEHWSAVIPIPDGYWLNGEQVPSTEKVWICVDENPDTAMLDDGKSSLEFPPSQKIQYKSGENHPILIKVTLKPK